MVVKQEYIDIMVSIQGFSVSRAGTMEGWDGSKSLMIELRRKAKLYRCQCGREFTAYYDGKERCVRDLSYGPYKRSYLVFWQVRVDCPECGVATEQVDWLLPRVTYTKRLAAAVALSCREIRSLKSIAEQYELDYQTVRDIDKVALKTELPKTSETDPQLIAVDEFAVRKKHHYATLVADILKNSIPHISLDRTKESLSSYYQELGSEKCKQIEAVAMDMWRPFESATREYCPNARIVYDPFHVIAAYGREVIDPVRIAEKHQAAGYELDVIRGSRFLLLKNADNLDPVRFEPARLSELLRLNKNLHKVYVLKDDLKQLWKYKSKYWAKRWFDGWYKRAMYSGIVQLKLFAKKLKRKLDGILAHCDYPIHTGFIEGIINKVKVIKRIAFGFRDMEYFFLKIRGAFRSCTHT